MSESGGGLVTAPLLSVVERGVTYTSNCSETGCWRLSGTPELSGGESFFLGRAPFDGLVSICSDGRWPRVIG